MTTYNRKFHPCRWLCCYLVAALPLLLAACTADDSTDSAATSLTIGVTEQPWQTEDISITRSGETLTALQASGFGLYSAGLGISNEQVTWSDTKWALAHTLIWPKTRPNDFYAYAPYAADPDITLSAADRQIGGLGIHLVRELMDSINYEREAGKNILTLIKKLK